jgi:hypothetical protein
MKRVRPPQPGLAVRVAVAERQFGETRAIWEVLQYTAILDRCARIGKKLSLATRLKWLLTRIFEDGENVAPHALDHDPALVLRRYNPHAKDVAARYTPHAHHPDFLVYRSKPDHQQKTTGRKPGAARTVTTKGSDIGIKTKFARLERKPKRGPKIATRKQPWPKRKFRK